MYKMCRTNTQSGRSMIEMLGVLAIIGVLSVGGIAGYSKALEKIKINKQMEQISNIINAILQYPKNYYIHSGMTSGIHSFVPFLKAIKAIDEEMYTDNEESFQDVWGNQYKVYYYPDYDYIGINKYISTEDNYSIDTCRNFFKIGKIFHNDIRRIQFDDISTDSTSNSRDIIYWGDSYCNGTRKCLKDLTLAEIETSCRNCTQGNRCATTIIIY